jgi:hypothetical protein
MEIEGGGGTDKEETYYNFFCTFEIVRLRHKNEIKYFIC